jgi:hypothetical protein
MLQIKNIEKNIPTKLTSLIMIRRVSLMKKEMRNSCTPQRFMCHKPMYEMKLVATRIPKDPEERRIPVAQLLKGRSKHSGKTKYDPDKSKYANNSN